MKLSILLFKVQKKKKKKLMKNYFSTNSLILYIEKETLARYNLKINNKSFFE